MGKNINSAQFNFAPDELAFISQNYIHLDHDQTWSGSAGAAYTFNMDTDHPTRFSADVLLQSGLRASTATVPNGMALPTYGVVNLRSCRSSIRRGTGTELRLDVLNVVTRSTDPRRHRRRRRRAAVSACAARSWPG